MIQLICDTGEMKAAWAIDNLFIGAMSVNPSTLTDDFEINRVPSPWLFTNNGLQGQYCNFKTRSVQFDQMVS